VIDTGSIHADVIPNAKYAAGMHNANVENQTDRRLEVIRKLGVSSVQVERG
jgi:hypothetical protein